MYIIFLHLHTQGADVGNGDILLVDPCVLRADGEDRVSDNTRPEGMQLLREPGRSPMSYWDLRCANGSSFGAKGYFFDKCLYSVSLGSSFWPFLGVITVRKWGCFPLTHHLGGDFDHGRIMRPASGIVSPSMSTPAKLGCRVPSTGNLHFPCLIPHRCQQHCAWGRSEFFERDLAVEGCTSLPLARNLTFRGSQKGRSSSEKGVFWWDHPPARVFRFPFVFLGGGWVLSITFLMFQGEI